MIEVTYFMVDNVQTIVLMYRVLMGWGAMEGGGGGDT